MTRRQKLGKVLAALLILPLLMAAEGCPEEGKGKPVPAPNPDTGPGGPARTPIQQTAPRGPIPTDPRPEDKHEWQFFLTWSPTKFYIEIDWDPNGPLIKPQRNGGKYTSEKRMVVGPGKTVWGEGEWTDLSKRNMTTPDSSIKCVLVVDGKVVDEETDIGVDALAHCEYTTR